MLGRCISTKVSASELSRKFIKSALLVGWVVTVFVFFFSLSSLSPQASSLTSRACCRPSSRTTRWGPGWRRPSRAKTSRTTSRSTSCRTSRKDMRCWKWFSCLGGGWGGGRGMAICSCCSCCCSLNLTCFFNCLISVNSLGGKVFFVDFFFHLCPSSQDTICSCFFFLFFPHSFALSTSINLLFGGFQNPIFFSYYLFPFLHFRWDEKGWAKKKKKLSLTSFLPFTF